jgi:hypothetical protein
MGRKFGETVESYGILIYNYELDPIIIIGGRSRKSKIHN